MPSRLNANWSGRLAMCCTSLVVAVCTGGCGQMFMTGRCTTAEMATLVRDDGKSPAPAPMTCGSPNGICSCGMCRPVWNPLPTLHMPRLPRLPHAHRLLWCFGPLFHWGSTSEDEALAEAELYPPHSRFHPVPTTPVFAQREEYLPPEPMMQTVPVNPHHGATPAKPLGAVPTQPAVPETATQRAVPGPVFVPPASSQPEPIPPGPADLHLDSGKVDTLPYQSEGRHPGSIRQLRR